MIAITTMLCLAFNGIGLVHESNGKTALSSIKASAITSDTDFEFDAETGSIITYLGNDTEVVIPSEIDGVTVTSVDDFAFRGCTSLENTAWESI